MYPAQGFRYLIYFAVVKYDGGYVAGQTTVYSIGATSNTKCKY